MALRLIPFTDVGGRTVYINPQRVEQLVPADAGNPKQSRTQIVFAKDDSIYVTGDVEAVAREIFDET